MNRNVLIDVILFLIFIGSVLFIGFRFFRTGLGNVSSLFRRGASIVRTTPTPTQSQQPEVQVTPTPTPKTTNIKVYAAGIPAKNIYPNMELYVNDQLVQSWNGVKGNPDTAEFQEFSYDFEGELEAESVRLRFTNHVYASAQEDSALYVGRISINGTDYPADLPVVYTLYSESGQVPGRCVSGYNRSRWLRCNGYFNFSSPGQAASRGALPTPKPAIVGGTIIKIYAAGTPAGGVYPNMSLVIKNSTVAVFNGVQGNVDRMQLQEYQYTYPGPVVARDVKISYNNDGYSPPEDRNLLVYKISINGVDYYADAANTFAGGIWRDGGCRSGFLRTSLLMCQGAYFQFDAPTGTRR